MDNLSYCHSVGREPFKYLNLGQLAEAAALKYGNVVALDSVEQNSKLTYLEALQESDKLAAGLRMLGMLKGDRLGLWAPNCLEWYVVYLACIRAGFLMVPLNPSNNVTEMEYSINRIGIKIIVCPYESKNNQFYEILTKIAPEFKNASKSSLWSSKLPSLKGIVLLSEEEAAGAYRYKDVMAMGNQNPVDFKNFQSNINPDDACYIHFSSGTTGKPKAIVLSHFQVINNSYVVARNIELNRKQHSICVQIPLFHTFGTIVAISGAAHFGATLVLPSMYYNSTKNFATINERRCSYVFGTPTMFMDLISIQERTGQRLKVEDCLMGAAPSSPELVRKIKTILNIKRVKVVYGLTETCSVVTKPVFGQNQCCDTVGYISDHLQVKVVDQNGQILPVGEAGEICVRGYVVMMRYWDDEESTKRAIQNNGWLRTGDVGVLQRNGFIQVVGRMTDLIIRGGENIYPKEIEDVLSTHPTVVEAQIIGIPHERLGEEVCACVKLRTGSDLSKSELTEFCKTKIAHYKIPTELRIVQDFPKTLSGKVKKGLLRELICNSALF